MTSSLCRLCRRAGALEGLYTFGRQPVAGYLDADLAQARDAPRFDLDIVLCSVCGHVQQAHDLAQPILLERVYSAYQPTYSMSPRVTAYVDWFVERALRSAAVSAGDLAIEVGSNDGQLLRRLSKCGLRSVGFEPAAELARGARALGLDVIEDYFGRNSAARFVGDRPAAKLVVTRHTLEHAFDPNDFLAGISTVLQAGGTAVVEVPYVRLQMLRGHFEAMTFQHVSFFSLRSIAHAFAQADLELVDLQFVDMDGGSFVAFARKGGAHDPALKRRVDDCLYLEEVAHLHEPRGYTDFFGRVSRLRKHVSEHLEELAIRGRRVLAYGAGGKGQALLNMLGLGSRSIQAVIDDTPGKAGKYVPGTDISVVTSSDPAVQHCDAILLTAPTHIDIILAKEFRRGRGNVQYMATVPDFHYVMAPNA